MQDSGQQSTRKEYPFEANWLRMLGGIVFFGFACASLSLKAYYNEQGLILNGLIKLEPAWATIFYWTIATPGGVITALFAYIIISTILEAPRKLIITDHSVSIPKIWFSSKTIDFEFAEIISIEDCSNHFSKGVYVKSKARRTYIGAVQYGEENFKEIIETLLAAWENSSSEE